MPELPEVESVRRQLDPQLSGRKIVDISFDAHPSMPRQFHQMELLPGREVHSVGRRGKFLIAPLDDGLELIMHLGMTGAFLFDHEGEHVRARLDLDDADVAIASASHSAAWRSTLASVSSTPVRSSEDGLSSRPSIRSV